MTLELQSARKVSQSKVTFNLSEVVKNTWFIVQDIRLLVQLKNANKEWYNFFTGELKDFILTTEKKAFMSMILLRDGLSIEGEVIRPEETVLQILQYYVKCMHIEHQRDIFNQYAEKNNELSRLENTLSLLLNVFNISIVSKLVHYEENPGQITYSVNVVSLTTLRPIRLKLSLQEKHNFTKLLGEYKQQLKDDAKYTRQAEENLLTTELKVQLLNKIGIKSNLYLL
jgi:hypothetical protein